MENTTHLFLAVRFNCNKCHDHPFERWTQDQYYQTAAYFARVELKPDPASGDKKIGGTAVEGAKPLYEIVSDKDEGEVIHDRTKEVAPPAVPLRVRVRQRRRTPRAAQQLAAWITSPDNPLLRPQLRQPAVGLPAGRGHHRTAGRHPRRQPADQPRTAGLPDRRVRRQRLRRRGT